MTRLEKISSIRKSIDTGVLKLPTTPHYAALSLIDRTRPCIYLGVETGELRQCKSCGGNVSLKVLSCKVYGKCTVAKQQDDLACCKSCNSYVASLPILPYGLPTPPKPIGYKEYEPIEKRHLLFHLLPVAGNGVWQKAIANLKSRWSLFTGKKFISIAQGGLVQERIDPAEKVPSGVRNLTLDSVETVKSLLPKDTEVIVVQNDPNFWEGSSWYRLWDSLYSVANPNDVVLYAHGKGVTRKLTSPCHQWTDLLYTLSLNYWSLTEKVLNKKPICGSLPKWGPFFGGMLSNSRWHYSGNFWWARCKEVLDKVKSIPLPPNQWSSEAWIGSAFHSIDAGILFESPLIIHLYHPHELDNVMRDYAKWSNYNLPDNY